MKKLRQFLKPGESTEQKIVLTTPDGYMDKLKQNCYIYKYLFLL